MTENGMPSCKCGKVERKLHDGRCERCQARYKYMQAFYKEHQEQMKASFKKYHRKTKQGAFEFLGGCFCAGCGETDMAVLTADHVPHGRCSSTTKDWQQQSSNVPVHPQAPRGKRQVPSSLYELSVEG